MNVVVILVAAGGGVRLGAAMPKAFAPLCGESLLAHALRGILGCGQVGHIVVVAPASYLDQSWEIVGRSRLNTDSCQVDVGHPSQVAGDPRVDAENPRVDAGHRRHVADDPRVDAENPRVDAGHRRHDADDPRVDAENPRVDAGHRRHDADEPRMDVVVGGADRSASVQAGLAALSVDDGIVLVHDVARCLAPADLFDRVIAAVRQGHQAVVPGLALTDTVKVVDEQGRVIQTPERESLRAIQTPQGFLRETLEAAHASRASATDDGGLVERIGGHVHVVAGDHRALKITTPADLTIATAVLQDGLYAG